ncbi:hypothetical protein E0W68_09960 [Flavobacterium salilacus subsp. salilacus]|uniref:hypothetical protein n=1 Tax=Flavobacterium TaxID=237 RepID=UPI001074B71A|nr:MULTISPECIES: hypothetical protein [Flavobacterium]KAF2518336.1 hypothetical protein E0W68_09960 [Flavobacterium salilacus subsp. salilacus]MBE1615249.1 hypothetical protein [Flavobacterium sp. SaA2.13]
MKKIVLFIFALSLFGCTTGKRLIEAEDIIGKWKEVQGRATKNSPLKDISTNCEDNSSNGSIFIFNSDGTFLLKSICPDKQPEEKGKWVYHNNILSLTQNISDLNQGDFTDYNAKYSVSNEGNNKIKLYVLSSQVDGNIHDDFDRGSYIILEKQ